MTTLMHKFLIYHFTSALHVSWFILAHLQRQVYNFRVAQVSWVGCQRPGADTIPRRLGPLWAKINHETCKAEVN
jgi:hypothetical protein